MIKRTTPLNTAQTVLGIDTKKPIRNFKSKPPVLRRNHFPQLKIPSIHQYKIKNMNDNHNSELSSNISIQTTRNKYYNNKTETNTITFHNRPVNILYVLN